MKKLFKFLGSMLVTGAFVFAPAASLISASAAGSSWINQGNEPEEYAYSMMVVGDIQIVTENDVQKNTNHLGTLYDYIVDNVEAKKVKHVVACLGDITNHDATSEWNHAGASIRKLDGVVPYSLVRGNHDIKVGYDATFGVASTYTEQYIEAYGKDTKNTVHEFSAGNRDYLVLALDYHPSDDVLAWANKIVEDHAYHNVIVVTHSYLQGDGTLFETSEWGANDFGPNGGEQIWDKFVRKHKNIVMVLSGHCSGNDIAMLTSTGDNGNTVQQFMINPQGLDVEAATGMVANLYFSEDGKNISVEWYSPVQEKYWGEVNQFNFTVDTIERADIQVKIEGQGTVELESAMLTGEPIDIVFKPAELYALTKVEMNGVDITSQVVGNMYTLNATEGTFVFNVRYELLPYPFSVINDTNKGTISFYDIEEKDSYQSGTIFVIGIKPKEGYSIGKVLFNGEELNPIAKGMYPITVAAQDNLLVVEYVVAENNQPNVSGGNNENSGDTTSAGCGSAIGGMSAVVLVSTIAGILIKKRED